MIRIDLLKMFEKDRKQLRNIHLQVISALERLNKAQEFAKCSMCERSEAEINKDVYERYRNCKLRWRCCRVVKRHKEYIALSRQEDAFREEYAKRVFAYLSERKPMLINRQSKETVSWDEAFDKDYLNLDPGLKTALVALVEETGGRYRIVET